MAEPVLETKLLLPQLRPTCVARPRLLDLLPRAAGTRLTLVSAPAGFGKTTLVASWLCGHPDSSRTAWVSLDERDHDAESFWTYVLMAVDRAVPGVAAVALEQVRAGRTPIETILSGLLNELSVLPDDLTLVLDDYHLADGSGVRPGMTFLVDHLPPQVHLVISTRADPALPLSRLRARGELVEIRAVDLRFSVDETVTYLGQVHGLRLPDADIEVLEGRTEGWAAALQLAALSLRGSSMPSELVAGFAGSDRFVVDYLVDEVLDRLPPDVRRFLLDTCVLGRMTGGLCDAVTGGTGGRTRLVDLERSNLFVVALDDHRRWYRYHHLFADVLRAHLVDERPEDVPVLHHRASDWFDRHADPERAVRHALAASDVERAAELVELAVPDLRRQRREAVIRRWVDELPADAVRNRPVLALGLIGALSAGNEFEGLEERLQDLERLMDRPAGEHVVVDRVEYARIPAVVPTYRAALSLVGGDLDGTTRYAEQALARADGADIVTQASAAALLGIAAWATGDLAAAHRRYLAAAEGLTRAGHIADVLGCTITLVDVSLTRGRLAAAHDHVESALRLAGGDSRLPATMRGTADVHVSASRIAWERGDLTASARHLDRAEELGEAVGLPQNPYRWRVAMARLREAAGDLDGAVGLLQEADRLYVGDFAPDVRPVGADLARVLAARGDVTDALARLRARGITSHDDVSYLHEYEHVTLARVLIDRHADSRDAAALSEATDLLQRLLAAARAGDRTRSTIEVLNLLSVAAAASGDRTRALDHLDEALDLAGSEGLIGVFTLDRRHLQPLVRDLLTQGAADQFLRRVGDLLDGSPDGDDEEAAGARETSAPSDGGRPSKPQAALVEPLSDRELDVLRYLCSELDGPGIARQLSVSLSTVRTHTQHIYAKLGVNNRRAAVRRAHQLDLLTAGAHRR